MYPASRIPLATMASAADRTSASVTLSAKWFQLFQPIGGVAATGTLCAVSPKGAQNAAIKHSFQLFIRFLLEQVSRSSVHRFSVALKCARYPCLKGLSLSE